jgi:hypothetical protein
MKRALCFVLLSIVASAAQAFVGEANDRVTRTTDKSFDAFGHCFVASQERASRPWWFVPRETGGGTFSNARSADDRAAYFLRIKDSGAALQIRLETGERAKTVTQPITEAIDSCI